ncbi:TonB-dependent receptor [Fulvivirgaceae bacterium PWU5]|uniref:TonB-dependent receptor n=1 Tax=Dawidia cretensis TaxID=2782350 RepID=A0AAP2E2C1_9BACT|nr:TonB-dependent receptor [Dawidia cretensis]MBT1710733.1 TonB-dependent receptor [Dawidia cretensis]
MEKSLRNLLFRLARGLFFSIILQSIPMTLLFAHEGGAQVNEVSQDLKKVSIQIDVQNASLEQLFKLIEQKTEFRFFYDKKALASDSKFTLNKELSLFELLSWITERTSLQFKQVKKNINVRSVPVKATAIVGPTEDVTVSGRVLSADDEQGLPGVNVVEKGTSNGTITDSDGNYSLRVPDDAVLVFSFVGYSQQEIAVGGKTIINISLQPDIQALGEVVVVGYGTVLRKDLVGAVDQVKADAIQNRPVANITQALQGLSPALVIQQRSMNPNDNTMNINIRGINSFNNNEPLVVIDGMIMEDVGSMNLLNPNDVESISVLKDAGASAIYGSRSANGVILITTKKGKIDMRPVVSFNASVGTQNPKVLLKPVKGYQNALLRNDSYVNAGLDPIYTPEQIANFAKGDSEWGMDAIMQNALQQNYNIGVQGGSKTGSYNLSFGYFDQKSNFKGPDYGLKRYNIRGNFVNEIGKVKVTTVLAYNRQAGFSDRGGLFLADVMRVPTYNTYNLYPDENGHYYNNDITTGGNMLATLYHGGSTTNDNDQFQGIVTGELDIWKGLKARAVLGYDLKSEHRVIRRRYYPVYDFINRNNIANAGSATDFQIEDYNAKMTTLNSQFLLDYRRTFNEQHTITGLFGYTNESWRRERNEIKKTFVDELYQNTDNTIIGADSYNTPSGTAERGLHSWLGRLNYAYGDKYYAEVSGRYDGSSRFLSERRWGFFPAVSAGWRVSEEPFFEPAKSILDEFRLRSTYGVLGAQTVDDYEFMTTYDIYTNQYAFDKKGVTGTGYTLGNDQLTWEKTATFNVGFDAAVLNNSLAFSVDYFDKHTSDILMAPPVPKTLGGAQAQRNIGEMRNRGFELNVSYRLNHGDFKHVISANLGDSYNEVVKFGPQAISKADEVERIVREGVPLYSYYGYKTAGLFQNTAEIENSAVWVGANVQPGDVKYVDRNKDGVIDDNDRFILGNAFPRYTFGFTYNMTWRGFDFSMMWQGVGKRDMALRGEMIEPFHGSYYYVMFEHQLDYWRPGNTDAEYPRLVNSASPSYSNNYGHGSDRNIYNAAYLRLKNIQIGYTVPRAITQKARINKLRLYATGQNLLTFSKNSFIDPESSEFGSSMNAGGANSGRNYPTLLYYGGGIEVEF